jgi:hypothetical protein
MPAKTEKQRRYFAYLYSIKKAGKKSDKWKTASSKIKKAVNSISLDTLHDFMIKESVNKYFLKYDEYVIRFCH